MGIFNTYGYVKKGILRTYVPPRLRRKLREFSVRSWWAALSVLATHAHMYMYSIAISRARKGVAAYGC